MFIEMRLFIVIFLLVMTYLSVALGEITAVCKYPEEKYFRAGLIEFVDFNCDEKQDCGLVINFPKTYQGTSFARLSLLQGDKDNLRLLAPLLTFEEEKVLSSHIYGKKDFLENLKFTLVYERVDGCAYWTTQELKHNKKHNEMDGSVEPPIR